MNWKMWFSHFAIFVSFLEMSVKAARRFYRVDSAHDLQFIDQGESATAENRWTFEIAWEVANKGKTTKTAEHVI